MLQTVSNMTKLHKLLTRHVLVKKEKETHAEVKITCINKISSVVTHFENKKEVQIEVQEISTRITQES